MSIGAKELAEIDSLVGTPTKVMGFGGAYDGAKRFDRDLQGWNPAQNSANGDMLPDKDVLDARSRDMARNDAYVQSGGTTHKDSIVGSMYMLNSKPRWRAMSLTEAWAEEFQAEVEELFTVWAESPAKWVDNSGQNDFTGLIRLAVGVYTFGGEVLATVEWPRDLGRDFNTAIQLIDSDRLMQPIKELYNPLIRGGIRHDSRGQHLSYFIRIVHPRDFREMALTPNGLYYTEVERKKPWGREQVIYIREQMRIDQTRAVGDIVAGLKSIAITQKFRDITLQNAVVNAMYAASIESDLPDEALYSQLGGGNFGDGVVDYATTYLGAISQYIGQSDNLKIDGVRVPHLFPGTKLQMRPAGTPGGVGQGFEQSLLRYIAASLNISYEELSRDYSNTNYSSARAAMAVTWRFMQSRKKIVADSFANSIYRAWLEEAINNDKLKSFPASKAPMLYTDSVLNLMFDALSQADWIGASRGQIDELKETQAAVLRIKYGLSTHEDELGRLGKDWRKVYVQLEREKKERELRNITLLEDNSVNAASGTPRDASGGGGKGGANTKDKKTGTNARAMMEMDEDDDEAPSA